MGGAVCVQSKDYVVPGSVCRVCVCVRVPPMFVHVCVACGKHVSPLSVPHAVRGVCAEHR